MANLFTKFSPKLIMVEQLLFLHPKQIYIMNAGTGGAPGGAKYHGGSSNETDHGYADKGTISRFVRSSDSPDSKTWIVADPGTGGEGVGCSKWKCRGGNDPGWGGGVPTYSYYSSVTLNGKTYSATAGNYWG